MRSKEHVSRSPQWLRPVSAVGAALIMALVVVPTASMAQHNADHYNDNDGDDNFQQALNVTIGLGVAGGVLYAAKRRHRGNRDQDQGAGQDQGAQGTGQGQ